MQKQSLNGKWTAACKKREITIPAMVPGDVYKDLLKAKQIPDPFYRDNVEQCKWIGESDWVYSRDFSVSKALLKQEQVFLKCHGLDTLATVRINGKKIAAPDNMFRTWEWDVKASSFTFKPVRQEWRKQWYPKN